MVEKVYGGFEKAITLIGFVLTVFPQNDLKSKIIIALTFISIIFIIMFVKSQHNSRNMLNALKIEQEALKIEQNSLKNEQDTLKVKLDIHKAELDKMTKNRETLVDSFNKTKIALQLYEDCWSVLGFIFAFAVLDKEKTKISCIHDLYLTYNKFLGGENNEQLR